MVLLDLLDRALCDKVCHWLATSRWFHPGTQVSTTNKTERHDISKIVLKVAAKHHKPKQTSNSHKPITNTAWVRTRLYKLQKGCTRLTVTSDNIYQLLAHGRLLSPGTLVSSTVNTGRHDIAEILLKVALNTINQIKSNIYIYIYSIYIRLKIKPNSVRIRFLELSNFCSSLDGIWTHSIDTLQHHSLSLTSSTLYIYIYIYI